MHKLKTRDWKQLLQSLFCFHKKDLFIILLGACGYFFAFPNPWVQIPPAVLLLPFSLHLLACTTPQKRLAASGGFICLLLGNSASLYWLSYPMIKYGGIPLPLAGFFVLLLSAYISSYGIIFVLSIRIFQSRLPLFTALIAGASLWGALELLRGWMFTGFPWLSLSSALIGWPILAQSSALFGMYGLSAVCTLIAMLVSVCLLKQKLLKLHRYACLLLALIISCSLLAYGKYRLGLNFKSGPSVHIGIAQGNIEQAQKWDKEKREKTIITYLDLSLQALQIHKENAINSEANLDLIVWPETAIPFVFQSYPHYTRKIRNFTRTHNTPLLFGVPTRGSRLSDPELYNSLWLLNNKGQDAGSYDKEHLVPFGEYIPRGFYIPFASEFLQGYGFTPGAPDKLMSLDSMKLGLLICYEGIFPELSQARVNSGANLLINVSNDAWFGFTSSPWQHLQLTAQRAIEQGRYIIRCTNTGISAMLDPCGRIINPSPLFRPHVQIETAWLLEEKTVYHKWYFWITLWLWLSPLLFLGYAAIKARNRKKLCNN